MSKKAMQQEIRRFWGVQKKKILRPNLYEQSIFESWKHTSNFEGIAQNITNNCEKDFEYEKCLFDLWESWKNRYTPHRWELSEQQFREFNAFMSQLSHENAQQEKDLYNLWETSKRFGLLQQTLFEIQEIWGSVNAQKQSNLRIRKLSPLECLKLMGFTKKDYQSLREIGLSDAAIFHCAGDSIVTTVLIAIFSQLVEKNHINIIQDYVERGIIKDETI